VLGIARRFLDAQLGPNYDLSQPLGAAILESVMQLDQYYVASGLLKPESFFGAYRKRIRS
jgi:hypothetical protein